jgi:hypothetical protein
MPKPAKKLEFQRRFKVAGYTQKWAVTMTKVRIRQAVAETPWPRWHFVSFCGPQGSESRGVVDMIAIRKDHGVPRVGTKRGDALQVILIQIKGGAAAKPTAEDGKRLRLVARHHGAYKVLLATWKKGKAAHFFELQPSEGAEDWREITDLKGVFAGSANAIARSASVG